MNLLDPNAIVTAALAHGAKWEKTAGYKHIFYIEGVDVDTGEPNDNRIDLWNDVRGAIEFFDGVPRLVFKCAATTTPGIYYDQTHIIGQFVDGTEGAALIALGSQACWQVGFHQDNPDHPCLRQTGGPCLVYRDVHQNLTRLDGYQSSGWYGINHHGTGGSFNPNSIGPHSAGCLVAEVWDEHLAFMDLVKQDPRYVADHNHIFDVIVMPTEWIAPGSSVSVPTSPQVPPTINADFAYCVKLVLVHEGGNDDDPNDPGGRTSRGIIQSEYDVWRQTHPGLPSDVWQAPQDTVLAIYKQKYWDALFCDGLPSGIDYAVFDYGVNSGNSRSAKLMQSILGVSADGIIGKNTIAAAANADAKSFINAFCDARLSFLQGLSTWGTFGRGWSTRVSDVRRDALAMVDNPPVKPIPAPAPDPVPTPGTSPIVIIPPPTAAAGGLTNEQIAQVAAIVQQLVIAGTTKVEQSPAFAQAISNLVGSLATHFPTIAVLAYGAYSVITSISTYGATPEAATTAAPAVLISGIAAYILQILNVLKGQTK